MGCQIQMSCQSSERTCLNRHLLAECKHRDGRGKEDVSCWCKNPAQTRPHHNHTCAFALFWVAILLPQPLRWILACL